MPIIVRREPNFRCRVSKKDDQNGNKFWRLCYAEDEAKAEEFLNGERLVVHEVSAYDFEAEWSAKTKEEAEKAMAACQAGAKWEFKAVWRELKDHLLDLFSNRCAYCESSLSHVAYGDVEHYRPKGKVTEDQNHPGYYWLAYDPENYLPSCQKCNQLAKKNHFPISGHRANGPADPLEEEEPLLLNPYSHEYCKYLRFMPTTANQNAGWALGIDPIGETTIEVLDLNRPALVERRMAAQQHIRQSAKQAVATAALTTEDWAGAVHKLRSEIESGMREYSTAALCEFNDFVQPLLPGLMIAPGTNEP